MARPYPDKFERDLSPLSPQSADSQTPISYSANVNRQKTKKWVEAKPADYGGDDWGDDYDYSASPPTLPKTLGNRQPGQVLQSSSSGGFPSDEINKKAYGDLPSLPTEAQGRSATSPIRVRANSFARDDERRAFSGGYAEPSQGEAVSVPSNTAQSNQPPALQISTQIPAVTSLRKTVQPSSPLAAQTVQGANRAIHADEPQSGASSKYSEATSKYSETKTPSSDFQTRRDFSPSAVPPPLQARHSPGPQNAATESPSSRFPPRKSSISHAVPPEIFQPQTTQEISTSKPWTEARSSSPGARAQSPTNPGKGHPFIRPADIYRRMEEEREKERQSLDSSRPSMESIAGGNSGERSSSPAKAPTWGQPASDSLGGSLNRGAIHESGDRLDSGQYLAPMLEPIQERKSEYGFEGYDASRATGLSHENTDFAASKESHSDRLSPEEVRRYSTSPKLPDLNRISGFGLDLFSQSSTGDTSFEDSVMRPISEGTPSVEKNESYLRNPQPLGVTSVTKQEFNAKSSSDLNTPVSINNKHVQRTGNEDTIIGISPITSRLASTTPSNNSEGALDTHENVSPLVEDDKPDRSRESSDLVRDTSERRSIPLSNEDIEEPTKNQARPMHQINTDTPSPARTSNITVTEGIPLASGGQFSNIPDPAISPVDEELPEPSRPFVERERSFRPNLPGGWVSYATTATDTTAEQNPGDHQGVEAYSSHADPMDIPVSPISESEADDNGMDLTPTTTKRSLPQSAMGATAGAALNGVNPATFGRQDKGMLSTISPDSALMQASHTIPGNNTLSTSNPNPALAPTGNPYAESTLDSRLQDEPLAGKSTLAIPEISSHVPASITSFEPPTPPPKDTPADEPPHINPEYFPPTVPLKHKTLDEVAASESLVLPIRPQMLPTLSTHTSPQDEESDKLRKEIIKSLSPNISDAEARGRLDLPDVPDNSQLEDSTTLGARESTYLPSEYDNYWETTNEAEVQEQEREAKIEHSGLKHEPEPHQLIQESLADVGGNHERNPPIPSLSPQRAERESVEMPPPRPSMPSNRFSWEAGPEEVSSTTAPSNAQLTVPSSVIDPRYAATPDSQLRHLEQTREAYFEHGPVSTSGNSSALQITPLGQGQENSSFVVGSETNEQHGSGGQDASRNKPESDAATANTAIAGAATYAGIQSNQSVAPQRRLSLAEEKSPANLSTYAVSPTPPEDQHPARVSQPTIPPSLTIPAASALPEVTDPVTMTQPQRAPDLTKIMQFKDILALQNPEQRIRAYNDTRDQFAAMDTGLADWLILIGMNQPNLPPGSLPDFYNTGDGAERSKIPKSGPSGVPGTPLQQPYYQQYLNASPTSSVPSMTRSGTGIISGSQQGFSSGGVSKPSGQQVQTKSKDLLHSAGVFGGKAGKAGKSLFTKGKNKLRGSGGGDKDSPPLEASPAPKPKVNEGRTSSWNLSLSSITLPRSSARTSTPSQHSREATPPPHRQSQLGPTTPQHQSQLGPENHPGSSAGRTDLSIWDAPVSATSTPSVRHSTPQPFLNDENAGSQRLAKNGLALEQDEDQDKLGVPAPIGKTQPSWDPHNATPIVEEDGFQYEERPIKQPPATSPATNPLDVPQAPIGARGDESIGDNLASLKSSEQPLEADDWIIISKENVPKLSELSFAAPVAIQNGTRNQSDVVSHHESRFQSSDARQTPVASEQGPSFQPPSAQLNYATNQPRPGFQPAAGYELAMRQQPPAVYQPAETRQLPGIIQSAAGYPPHAEVLGPNQPPAISQPPVTSQIGFRGRFIQHIRQRSSKDGNMPVTSHSETDPSPMRVEQLHTADENKSLDKRPTEFVGLPPIRRSSTFGLGFRAKDPGKRFALDDEEEEEDSVQQKLALPSASEDDHNLGQQEMKTILAAEPRTESNGQFDGRLSGREAALGATAIAAAVGDRMNQPSGEPSRDPHQDPTPTETQDESQQRPPLSNVSSEYSRPSSFSPVSPPVSSPVSPPGSRPPFAADAARDAVRSPIGQQANAQQPFASQDRRPDADWQPNIKQSQEQRVAPLVSYQRSQAIEAQRGPLQNTPMAIHPRHPSFEGQRPIHPPSHARDPSFDGQRLRSPSSNQGNGAPLAILGSGVFVPPPRSGANQQKPFDQPPSSAQRYPALFRAEQGEKESSVDGLPSHYYQAPISKEDAFLPRQQTNEYQLPGVGPPPDQPQSGKRNSKRNSALLKELGGRLSRSASRDRDSIADSDARSPIRPVDSRDSQSRDYSAASITSEDTGEKKKRKSGLSFLGGLRREPTAGLPPSRESMVTHLPVSRTDSLSQPQPQKPSSSVVPADKKKLFFSSNHSSPDIDKPKPNKLLRVSTSSAISEQPGKKKRFSGITNMFSKQSIEQERRGSGGSTGQARQDTRNNQQFATPLQGHHYLEYPAQQNPQETRKIEEIPRSMTQGGPPSQAPSQAPSQNRQDSQLRGLQIPIHAGQSTSQPTQMAQGTRGIQRQESPSNRGTQIAQPLPSPSLVNPTLQTSLIETRPVPERHSFQQYSSDLQGSQGYQRQPARPDPLSQSTPVSQDLQGHQKQATPPNQKPQPIALPQNLPNHSQQAPNANQPSLISQLLPTSQISPSISPQASIPTQPGPFSQPATSSQISQGHQQQVPAIAQPSPVSQSVPASQNPQSYARQNFLAPQASSLSKTPTSLPHSQFAEARGNQQPGPGAVNRGVFNTQLQTTQYQQREPVDFQQANLRQGASPQAASRASQERQHVLMKQSPAPSNQPKMENKSRQGSTAKLFGGLIGGRRSSAQQAKHTTEAQPAANPQMATPLIQSQQQQLHPQLQLQHQQQWQQQQMSPNTMVQGMSGQNQQRGRPTSQEPQYDPLPIPGAYNLVRGEGGRLAPTPYDPRGLNTQSSPYGNQQFRYQEQPRSFSSGAPQVQSQPYTNDQYTMVNRSGPPQNTTIAAQNINRDVRPNPGPLQNSQNGNKSGKPLSSEDLVARSPARPQFGQQAPYQLSLPDENADDTERDRSLHTENSAPSDRNLTLGGKAQMDRNPLTTDRSLPAQQILPPTANINTNQQASNPSLRHPLSPATYPLPEHAPFSPINPKAAQIPPPPPPKWPQQVTPSQNLDRSNTINTHASEVSQLSGEKLSVPGVMRPKEQERPASVTPPSPQITPDRSPEQTPRHMAPSPQEEDVYSASPRESVVVSGNAHSTVKPAQPPHEKTVADGQASQNLRRRTSQEEKILVEEGMIRPGSEQEELPSMSATSYPGQEWHPYGNGYEEWD